MNDYIYTLYFHQFCYAPIIYPFSVDLQGTASTTTQNKQHIVYSDSFRCFRRDLLEIFALANEVRVGGVAAFGAAQVYLAYSRQTARNCKWVCSGWSAACPGVSSRIALWFPARVLLRCEVRPAAAVAVAVAVAEMMFSQYP